MTQTVYVFVADGGDGSSSVCFTKDVDLLSRLEEQDPEGFGINEGSYSDSLIFPDDLNLEDCGFDFYVDDEEL